MKVTKIVFKKEFKHSTGIEYKNINVFINTDQELFLNKFPYIKENLISISSEEIELEKNEYFDENGQLRIDVSKDMLDFADKCYLEGAPQPFSDKIMKGNGIYESSYFGVNKMIKRGY